MKVYNNSKNSKYNVLECWGHIVCIVAIRVAKVFILTRLVFANATALHGAVGKLTHIKGLSRQSSCSWPHIASFCLITKLKQRYWLSQYNYVFLMWPNTLSKIELRYIVTTRTRIFAIKCGRSIMLSNCSTSFNTHSLTNYWDMHPIVIKKIKIN